MLRIFNIFFYKYRRIIERFLCFAAGHSKHLLHLGGMPDDSHSAAAAARSSLYDYRVTDLIGIEQGFVFVCDAAGTSHCHRDTVFQGDLPGNSLVAHLINCIRGGADENYPAVRTLVSKIGVLRKEPVSRMDCIT